MPHTTDLDLTAKEVAELASPDAITAFLAKLGYDTADRDAAFAGGRGAGGRIGQRHQADRASLRRPGAVPSGRLRPAEVADGQGPQRPRASPGQEQPRPPADPGFRLRHAGVRVPRQAEARAERASRRASASRSFPRRSASTAAARPGWTCARLRRFTWTCRDALEQFDKLRSVFDAAAYTGEYFQNRGLFSDYFLRDRLREDPAWRDNPSEMFAFVRDLLRDAQARWSGKDKDTLRNQLLEPLFKKLGFKATVNRPSKTDQTQPDYLLKSSDGGKLTAAFVYAWDRWLDGPDLNDTDTPEENPGACVVTALDAGTADWIIVTNGRLWRLYSRQAHARATNFYEVDLVEALTASGDTDPNEAFRYWWLFFRPDAFKPKAEAPGLLAR